VLLAEGLAEVRGQAMISAAMKSHATCQLWVQRVRAGLEVVSLGTLLVDRVGAESSG
jgi:hypothetical protein